MKSFFYVVYGLLFNVWNVNYQSFYDDLYADSDDITSFLFYAYDLYLWDVLGYCS